MAQGFVQGFPNTPFNPFWGSSLGVSQTFFGGPQWGSQQLGGTGLPGIQSGMLNIGFDTYGGYRWEPQFSVSQYAALRIPGYQVSPLFGAFGTSPFGGQSYGLQFGTFGISPFGGQSYGLQFSSFGMPWSIGYMPYYGSGSTATHSYSSNSNNSGNNASNNSPSGPANGVYIVVDTSQNRCYDNGEEIPCPQEGESFYGQDAQYEGVQPAYRDNGDGTVTDLNTGFMWAKAPAPSKMNYNAAETYAASATTAGYDDWRLPTVKELYSLIDYSCGWPYIDTTYFDCELDPFESKNTQYWSSTKYVGLTHGGQATQFGVNFATGHIKGYGTGMPAFVRLVRGGILAENSFVDNSDGTVTDMATGLMWQQADSGTGMDWENALDYAENMDLAGYDDWRLPNAKELQSIVDYTHSPNAIDEVDKGPAINTDFFDITELATGITNEDPDYGYFWTSTSAYFNPQSPGYYYAWYVAFGTAVDDNGEDIHGAGAVRFDTKVEGGPAAEGAERIYNYVRCVRGSGQIVEVSGSGTNPSYEPQTNNPLPSGGQPPANTLPPPEAIDACIGLMEGDICGFLSPNGTIEGTCLEIQGQMACVPEGGPPEGNPPAGLPPINN